MNELQLQQQRIERLRAAIDKVTGGNRTAFAKRLGYLDGAFVRQMLAGDRAVTEKTIRAIEALPGMEGWFEASSENDAHQAPLSSDLCETIGKTFPDTPQQVDAPILDAQQIDEFIRELKEVFRTGDLTPARFALLQGLLREGRESLAGNFMREKQAVGGRTRGKGRKQRAG